MATYLKGITDVVPQITPFTPDFGMLQKTLSSLQSRYEQGFASVKNAYNQVLNAPLSDPQNRATRDRFVKEAEQKLKDISSVDLSLPENQATAEGVFAPFWEDNLMLQDTSMTKWYQGEIQKAMATRDSQEEKVRSQYSDVAVRYLQNGLEKLQAAGRDPGKYAQLEKRRFVPFQDAQAYLDMRAKEQGLEISWQTANGPELKTITGGKEALPSFEAFAHNALGDQFTDQFRIMGVVDKEEKIRQLKKWNPALTDQEAMNMISTSIIKEKKDSLTSQQSKWDADMKRITDEIKPYQTLPGLSTEQKNAYARLLLTQAQLKKQVDQATSELGQFAQLEQTPERFSDKLDGYFSDILKQRTIKRWANTRAAKQEEKVTLNTVWQARYQAGKDERDYQWERWKYEHPQKKTGKSKGSSSSSSSGGDDDEEVDITDPEQVGKFEAIDTTHMSEIGEPEKIFNHEQQERWSYAHQELFSDEVGGRILRKKNIDTERAVEYLGAMRKLATDPEGEQLTEKDRVLLYNLSQELKGKSAAGDLLKIEEGAENKKTKGFGDRNFYQMRGELLGAMKENLEKIFRDDSPGFEDDDFKMLMGYMTATRSLEEHSALETNKSELIEKHILGNKEYEPFVVEQGGKKRLINENDLAKQFQRTVLRADGTGEIIEYSAKDMASLYMSGAIGFREKQMLRLKIHGKEYLVEEYGSVNRKDEAQKGKQTPTPGGKFGLIGDAIRIMGTIEDPYGEFTKAIEAVDDRYGSSKKFKQKMDGVYKKIVPDLPQYQSKTGAMGFVVRYDFNKKTQGEAAVGILNEAAESGNYDGVYLNGTALPTGNAQKEAILSAMSLREDQLEDVVSAVKLRTRGVNGRPSLQVVFKPSTKAKTESQTPIEQLAGQTVEIDLNPNPSGDTLRRVRYNPGNYVYGSLLRGKTVKSDPILESGHVSFKIMPNDPNNPSGAIVEINSKDFVNGRWVDAKQSRAKYSWSQYTPDQLVEKVHEIVRMQYLKNLQARKLFYQQHPQGEKLVSPREVEEQITAMIGQSG